MNVQRLRDVLVRLRAQLDTSQADQRLLEIENPLQQQQSQPAQPSFQHTLSEAMEHLRNALRDAQDEPTTTLWHEALKEIGIERLAPSVIFQRARAIIDGANMMPAVALERIR